MPPRKRIGQLLVEMKIVDEHQLQSALGYQKQWGGKLGAILVQKGFCREDQVVTALSQHLNMPAVRLADVKIDPRAAKLVSRSVAERLHVFAYEVSGSGRSELITIAMSDPTDLSSVDQLAFHTGKRIKPMLAGDTEVLAAIQQYYAPEKPAEGAPASAAPAGLRPSADGAKAPGALARPTPIAPMAAAAAAVAAAAKAPPPQHGSGFAAQPAPAAQTGAGEEPASAEPAPEALEIEGADLPVDAPMDGLEPIAAYSQGEMNVDGAEGVAPQDMEAGSADEPVPLEDQSTLQGWTEGSPEGVPLETPESEAVRPPPAVEGWSEGDATQSGWAADAPTPAAASDESTFAAGGAATDELPMDAIMGTADFLEEAPEPAPPALDAPDAWSDISDPLAAQAEGVADESSAAPTSGDAEGGADASQDEAQATDSDGTWEAAAAAVEAAANEAQRSEEIDDAAATGHATADEDPSGGAGEPTGAGEADQWAAENEGDGQALASAVGDSFLESPDDSPAAVDEVSIDPAGWSDDSDASHGEREQAFSMSSPAEEPPSAGDAEASFDVDTQDSGNPDLDGYRDDQGISATERQGWLLRQADRDLPPEGDDQTGYATDGTGEPEQEEGYEQQDSEQDSFEAQQDSDQQEGHELRQGEDRASFDDPGSYPVGAGDQGSYEQDNESIELATDEGWTAPEDVAQGGWFGDALSSTTPLSPADLGTLAALGLDPADGAAAQRILACLVRVLNRRQAIDLEELAAEIRESQLAADAGAQAQGDDGAVASDPDAAAPAADEAAQPSGSEEDPWTGSHDS